MTDFSNNPNEFRGEPEPPRPDPVEGPAALVERYGLVLPDHLRFAADHTSDIAPEQEEL